MFNERNFFMKQRRVVVTGIGTLNPLGNNIEEYFTNLTQGVSGAGPITHFDPSNFKTKFACELKGYDPNNFFDRKEVRKYDLYTQYAFHRHFCLATKHRTDGLTFANLAFPLVLPMAPDKTVAFEERGRPKMDGSGGYKGKAEGSNSSEGLWIANLTGAPLDKASEIVWFESAYDAMAEYQINPVKMVYVSTGGTPTEGQMRGLLSVTPNARHYLGFDKDDAGRQFVANFRKVAAEMGFRHEHVQAYHPLGCYKDWNDALLNKKSAELIAKGEPDTFDYAEFIAAGKAEKQREKEEKNTYHRSV